VGIEVIPIPMYRSFPLFLIHIPKLGSYSNSHRIPIPLGIPFPWSSLVVHVRSILVDRSITVVIYRTVV